MSEASQSVMKSVPPARPAAHALRPLVASLASALVAAGLFGAYFFGVGSHGPHGPTAPVSSVRPADTAEVRTAREALAAQVEDLLTRPVRLAFDGRTIETTWRALGVVADDAAIARRAASGWRASVPAGDADEPSFPVRLDPERALTALVDVKDETDRPPVDARLDLDKREVMAERPGLGVHVYESMALIEEAARAGAREVPLAGGELPPAVTRQQLGNPDISHILGWFETHYPPGEKDRNYNLKLAAEKLNGHILLPGQEFSFNDVVGDRTEKQGYRVAHVIQAGEMVDGLAGGACQISSTLHGASWFAGLEFVHSIPHSRPSAYIAMGLDATVVYPTTDLKLKNPYDFPVAIRYSVSQGTVRVEILGKARPYERVAFEREIKKEIPYETITREDEAMPVGSSIIEQMGFPGYELERRRLFYEAGGKLAKKEKWLVRYPPTTEYVRMGTNPNPNLKAPEQQKLHGPMPPGDPLYRLAQ